MAILSMQLDPNAASYTDDEIVGKVNAATANITRAGSIEGTAASALDLDDIGEGTTNKHLTSVKDTKLTGIEDGATADQTGTEVRDVLAGLADTDRQFIMTNPVAGEFKVINIHRQSDGKLDIEYDDTAV